MSHDKLCQISKIKNGAIPFVFQSYIYICIVLYHYSDTAPHLLVPKIFTIQYTLYKYKMVGTRERKSRIEFHNPMDMVQNSAVRD